MQEIIIDVLRKNGPLKTAEIAIQVGKKRAKDVQKVYVYVPFPSRLGTDRLTFYDGEISRLRGY